MAEQQENGSPQNGDPENGAPEKGAPVNGAPDDIKQKMREALDKKGGGYRRGGEQGVHEDGPLHEKAHGSEVRAKNVGPQNTMHRRKAGGGGS